MSDVFRTFYDFVKEHQIINENDHIIIGLSGGADSMCLLILLDRLSKEFPIRLTAVHVNHQLRGKEADEDEAFVKDFCEKRKIQCIGVHAAVRKYAMENGLSIEEAGRTARYQTFLQVARKIAGTDTVPDTIKAAVAHHRDDNAETILLNLARGTGLKGLQGMQISAQRFGLTVIRPLLCLGRSDIEAYLKQEKVDFRTDSTNLEDEYSRNKVRLNIIPQLNEINPKAAVHIHEAARSIVEAQEFIEEEARKAYGLIADKRNDDLYIDLERFTPLNIVVKRQLIRNAIEQMTGSLKDITRIHIENVLGLENRQTGRKVELPYGLLAIRSYSNLILRPMSDDDRLASDMTEYAQKKILSEIGLEQSSADEPEAFMVDPTQLTAEAVRYQLWKGMEIELQLVHVNAVSRQYLITKNEYTKAFDCAKIKGNLLFRKPDLQEEIQFFGGKKSIRKFFVDEKIPQEERKQILVLSDEENIMWIIGYRMSESYKLSEMTNLAVQVRICGGPDE